MTDVLIAFSGWYAPWQQGGGKSIPLSSSGTLAEIVRSVKEKVGDTLQAEAYATDTNDDVKTLAIKFIEDHLTKDESSGAQLGKLVIYGYSWGGDTAVELTKDLGNRKSTITVELLVTVDSALGPFNGPAVRDRIIPVNVKKNLNYLTTTPQSRIGSKGMKNTAKNPDKTQVINKVYTGPTHGEMDEYTKSIVIDEMISTLKR